MDILDALQRFGSRMRYDEERYDDDQVFWPNDEIFWNTEPGAEEGWATENQVRLPASYSKQTPVSAFSRPGLDSILEGSLRRCLLRAWSHSQTLTISGFWKRVGRVTWTRHILSILLLSSKR